MAVSTAEPDFATLTALNMAEFFVGGARDSGQPFTGWNDVTASDRRMSDPLCNSAFLTQPLNAGSARDLLTRLTSFYAESGSPWILWSAWKTPDLTESGLTMAGTPPLMLRDRGSPVSDRPPDLQIKEVTEAEELRLFNRVFREGYPIHESPADSAAELFGNGMIGGPARFWNGYVGGECVSVASACTANGIVTINCVATLGHARRRGYGAALTDVAARCEPELPVLLLSSDLGRPVYERLGFREIDRWVLWHCGSESDDDVEWAGNETA